MKGVSLLFVFVAALRLCDAQTGVCYITASQVVTQSYYVQTSYTYYYDCSNFGWGWSYCAATGYTSTLTYSSSTGYVTQFACCTGYTQVGSTQSCTELNECSANGGLGPCQQICTNTAGSFYCSCNRGYDLSGYFCNDINECASNGGLGPCQQNCTNTIGSYYCRCNPGYVLSADGASCHYLTVTPSVTPTPLKAVLVQVRLLNLVDCSMWTVPVALRDLIMAVEKNVSALCGCNFTIANAYAICYDVRRVTVRGEVGAMQVGALESWVTKTATTVNVRGTSLAVDNGCTVQIGSADDPECPVPTVNGGLDVSATISAKQVPSTVSAQKASANSFGLPVGLALGCLLLFVVLTTGVVIALMIVKKKKSSSKTINPLYQSNEVPAINSGDENPYANVDDNAGIILRTRNTVEYYNTKTS